MGRLATRLNWPGGIVILWLVLAWYGLVTLDIGAFEFVPSPTDVAAMAWELTMSGELLRRTVHTTTIVLITSFIAIVAGTIVGSIVGLNKKTFRYSMASVDFLRSVPTIALVPAALIVWGPTTESEVILASYAASFPMMVNISSALRQRDSRLGDIARTFRLSRQETFVKIWLPSVMPAALVGARLSVIHAMIITLLVEITINPEGLGWGLIRAQQALRPDALWAYALLIGVFGYLLNVLLIVGVRALSPGGKDNPGLIGA